MKNKTDNTVLIIEDNQGDTRLITEMLDKITSFKHKRITAETLKDGRDLILKNELILIILDLNLPDSKGKATFDAIIQIAKDIPIVLVSAIHDLKLSLQLITEGAQDYILKQEINIVQLEKAIQFAIERKKLISELQETTQDLKQTMSYFVDRELKMVELKKEIDDLQKEVEENKKE
jgi:DNA-binding NtrC family response regulator